MSLTPEQKKVVETWGQGIAVMAGAGSGKTFTLVQKVEKLFEMNPEARFVAVSFTEKSAKDLRIKLTDLSLKKMNRTLSGQWVTTIHGFCSNIIREYPREAGFDGDEKMLSAGEAQVLWEQTLRSLWLDEIPPEVDQALDSYLEDTSQTELVELLKKIQELSSFGVLEHLKQEYPHLHQIAQYVLTSYKNLKKRQGAMDFNDLEQGAFQALQYVHVAQDYHQRFDLVMVDEFQDTNPIQEKIITRFVKPRYQNLCVVGDPKQSIYRFRNADVSVFEEFCSRLPVHVELTLNFRSVPGVLEFCNEVCEPVFLASEMKYQKLIPFLERDPTLPPVESVIVQGPGGLVQWIKNELAQGKILSEMVILTRTTKGGNLKWIKELIQAGIPIALESGGGFWVDPRVRELCALLKWWSNPGNEYSAVVFFRAPWCAVNDSEIDHWRKQDPSFVTPFFRSEHRLARLLAPLYRRKGMVRPGEVLVELLKDPHVESEMGPLLLQLWHQCETFSQQGMNFQRIVADLTEEQARAQSYLKKESRHSEKTVPPPKNLGLLRVMTIHGSKGLEFPTVILIDFPEKPKRAPHAPRFYFHHKKGVHIVSRDENGKLKKEGETLDWTSWEENQSLAEEKRVLYVAMTRAQKRLVCVLPTTLDPDAKEKIQKTREKIQDTRQVSFWRAWIEKSIQKYPARDLNSVDSSGIDVGLANRVPLPEIIRVDRSALRFHLRHPRHSVSDWVKMESELKMDQLSAQAQESSMKEAPFQKEINSAEIGTRVHRLLELGDFEGLSQLEAELKKELGFQALNSAALKEWAQRSKWMRDDTGLQVWRELAFEVPVDREVLVGAVDRLVFDGKNYKLIDFKFTLKHRTPDELVSLYQTQLNLYAWSLMKIEPRITGQNLSLLVVHISSRGVVEVPIVLQKSRLHEMKDQAVTLLAETQHFDLY